MPVVRKNHTIDQKAPEPLAKEFFVHSKCQSSILSTSQIKRLVNFRGLLNCMGLFLIVSNINLIIHNFEKYGLLALKLAAELGRSPNSDHNEIFQAYYIIFISLVVIFLLVWVEQSIGVAINRRLWDSIHLATIAVFFILPSARIYFSACNFFVSFIAELYLVVLFMKVWSLQYYLSIKRNKVVGGAPMKPITPNHFVYFLLVPTLCYQPSYPRNEKIRIWFCLKKTFEVLFCIVICMFLITQYVFPHTFFSNNSKNYFEIFVSVVLRILKVSFPITCAWLLAFYAFFHAFLNLLSELLRFGDKLFYLDWWNTRELAEYWRKWNLPVQNWVGFHIYSPLKKFGLSRQSRVFIVFLLSACFHEIIMTVSFHHFTVPYSFTAMILQVPLMEFSRRFNKTVSEPWPNLCFWILFCLFGTPVVLLCYCTEYLHLNPDSVVLSI